MSSIQLFLNAEYTSTNINWNKELSDKLKGIKGVTEVMIIEKGQGAIQINISFDPVACLADTIMNAVTQKGGKITEINLHFPSDMTGISDPYGASAVSLKLEEKLGKVDNVTGGTISSSGIIKITLASSVPSLGKAISEIIDRII